MIKIYSTPTCPYCVTVKDFLTQKGIQFEDINVATNIKAREEMFEKSKQMGVPVIDIDGEIIIGFDREKICEVLKINC